MSCGGGQVSIGRLASNEVSVTDNEVSGHHAAIQWEATCRCWQVRAAILTSCLLLNQGSSCTSAGSCFSLLMLSISQSHDKQECQQVMDLGSLNGTTLNGRIISTSNRRKGRLWRVNDGDEIQLGVNSAIKLTYLPVSDAPVRLFQHNQ